MKDISCPIIKQVNTCDGDNATIIGKGVNYFTVQGVPKIGENTLRKNKMKAFKVVTTLQYFKIVFSQMDTGAHSVTAEGIRLLISHYSRIEREMFDHYK